ncbi:MAG: hypothetical protein Q7J80_12970 [Anaerolineales bacterium]|nr:hypothetical protein [Anaerolineales bacterium]
MNTAQVSIELILAGILALCAFVLPFWTGSDISKDLLQSNALIGFLGMAYLFGVVFDKLADMILNPFEKFKRLQQADEYLSDHPRCKGDPYPQNVLEFRLRKSKDGRLDWMDSLKSRIRTSRELAVLGLPATMGITLYQSLAKDCAGAAICPSRGLYMFVVINIVLVFAAVLNSKSHSRMPNTNQLKTDKFERARQMIQARRQMYINSSVYYLMMINSALAIAFVAVGNWGVAVFGLGGVFITLLGLWTWSTITRTYLKFIAREMPNLRREEK